MREMRELANELERKKKFEEERRKEKPKRERERKGNEKKYTKQHYFNPRDE